MILTAAQIKADEDRWTDTFNRTFWVPDEDWLLYTVGNWYLDFLWRNGITRYKKRFNCDAFAFMFKSIANLHYASDKYCPAHTGPAEHLALGAIRYRTQRGAHWINEAYVLRKRRIKRIWIEPEIQHFKARRRPTSKITKRVY